VKRYRLLAISLLGVAGVLLGVLFVGNINGNLVYFLTPQEALAQKADFDDGRRFQLGGLVQDGSVETTDDGLRFLVASGPATVPVAYGGAPAQLFRPGIGVVLEGAWDGDTFRADTMIIKHDENYRPPDDGDTDESLS
jgi:cytochrome c-type biogenesis protein CcmE